MASSGDALSNEQYLLGAVASGEIDYLMRGATGTGRPCARKRRRR